MAYEIGTADNYIELLERLKDFLTNSSRTTGSDTNISEISAIPSGEVWTVKRHNTDWDGSGNDELILMGQGTAGEDEIYVGIQTYNGTSAYGNYYNWKLQGYTGYNAVAAFDSQPGAIPSNIPRMLLWNSSIPYWFFANGRRFIVVAQVDTVYEACYLGFYLPYGTPSQMPYPLIVGGSATQAVYRYSQIHDYHSLFVDPLYSTTESTLAVLMGSSWVYFNNIGAVYRCVWPYICGVAYSGDSSYDRWRELKGGIDGNPVIFPLLMYSLTNQPTRNVYGEMQGCFATIGDSLSSKDTITIGSDVYIVFQNVYRTNKYNYWAVKKE